MQSGPFDLEFILDGRCGAIRTERSTRSDCSTPTVKDELKVERPRLHKVILVNDDYTPREFVVLVLKAEFRVSEDQAMRVMITAHQRGVVRRRRLQKDVAEAKATNATDAGPQQGLSIAVHDRA